MIEPVFNEQPQQNWFSISTTILKYIFVPVEE
jgi:hypothetical protein